MALRLALGKPGKGLIHIWIEPDGQANLQIPAKPLVQWVVLERKLTYKGQNIWNETPVFQGPSTASALCAWLDQKYGVPSIEYLDVTAWSSDGQTKIGHWVGPIGYIRGASALKCGS